MERVIPTGVFCLGLGALGWWSHGTHAERMEAHVQEGAEAALVETTRHGAEASVSGRDIVVTGFAHDDAERKGILASLDGVDGRRVVIDNLTILPRAETYFLEGSKDASGLVLSGVVPDQAQLDAIKAAYPGANTDGLSLASGAPNADWTRAATGSLAALDQLDTGLMRMEGTSVFLSGEAGDGAVQTDAETRLAALPQGYSQNSEITAPQKTALFLTIDPVDGARISGVAPKGFEADRVAEVLGVAELNGTVSAGASGTGDAELAKIAAIGPWLSEFENLTLTVQDGRADLKGEAAAGVDAGMLSRSVKSALGAGSVEIAAAVMPEPTPAPEPATATAVATETAPEQTAAPMFEERVNVLTGETETLRNGFWLPVQNFEPTPVTCRERTNEVLAQSKVKFVPASAELDTTARAVVNRLAGLMLACVEEADLSAEVAGHTDDQGSEAANLELSEGRARAVIAALSARGIPSDNLIPVGLGETKPIADNGTEDGRAANRRTEIRWINN